MTTVETAVVRRTGSIRIPPIVLESMGIGVGTKFMIVSSGDTIVLRPIRAVTMRDFDAIALKARRQAKAAGLKQSDIARAIAEVRKEP